MKFDWDPVKNEKLKEDRGVSFEEIALALGEGALWKIENHYNKANYPNQKIFFVPIRDYIYMVPFVKDDDTFFLKTAFPSRKATKEFKAERN